MRNLEVFEADQKGIKLPRAELKTAESQNAQLTGKVEMDREGFLKKWQDVLDVTPKLEWTKKKPTGQGFYWFRGIWEKPDGDMRLAEIVEVSSRTVVYLFNSEGANPIGLFDGEWAGPIDEPKET